MSTGTSIDVIGGGTNEEATDFPIVNSLKLKEATC